MLKKRKKQNQSLYRGERIRRIAIRSGSAVIVILLLLCYFEEKKETIAAACYEETICKATVQGRWLKYGQYEPDTLYQKIIDKIPVFHHTRLNALQAESKKTENNGEYDDAVQSEKPDTKETDIKTENENAQNKKGSLLIRYAYGTVQPLQEAQAGETKSPQVIEAAANTQDKTVSAILATVKEQYRWEEITEKERFLKNYYIADVSVGNVNAVINGKHLLDIDTSLERVSENPQVLVYHTHGTESYKDSREGVEADTVIGMGDILCEELTAKGFSVIHDRTTYDFVNGKDNRDYAYTTARPQLEALLKEYPSIEVVLDIHRDSGAARRVTIEGKDTAQIMLFNGLCRNADGPISYLSNPYLDDTLAFSLQLNLLGRERYPGLMYKIYLKNYRYNMHFTGHCMLVELGTQNNTVEEAQNGVRYLAELLYELLTE